MMGPAPRKLVVNRLYSNNNINYDPRFSETKSYAITQSQYIFSCSSHSFTQNNFFKHFKTLNFLCYFNYHINYINLSQIHQFLCRPTWTFF